MDLRLCQFACLRRAWLFLALLFVSPVAYALSTEDLAREMGDRTQRVPEFQFIREEAKRLGVRAYLFGGTAAAYGHYVKWDLDREAGNKKYLPERFDYDYTNIYRSTQDLDIVIDGSPEKAAKLQEALANAYPHFLGNKGQSAWEVRLLRQSLGDKLAILDNPDFLNQHTDSNSTGMVEITETPKGESPVRDVMDWESHEPNFLKDLRENKLHYYFNPKHGTTKFAKEGRNPPILSVIRYLTKALQFEAELRPEDLAQVKKIIKDFNPERDTQNEYVRRWLLEKENGRKLVQNAVNMEYARKLLDETGLRKKLLAVPGVNPQGVGSLGWWLNKQPLESKPLGKGSGKTARELGLDMVAHEAASFEAWESITKSPVGEPNVFISRHMAPGESASYGDGFYTRKGREGAVGNGNTIRFHLDPEAREGSDFRYVAEQGYVVVKNRKALHVIPESLNWDYPHFFAMVLEGRGLDSTNKAQFQKLNRRLKNQRATYTPEKLEQLFFDALRSRFKEGHLPDPQAILSLAYEYVMRPGVSPSAGSGKSLAILSLAQEYAKTPGPAPASVAFGQALKDRIQQEIEPLLKENILRPGLLEPGDRKVLKEYQRLWPDLSAPIEPGLRWLADNAAVLEDLEDIETFYPLDTHYRAYARVAGDTTTSVGDRYKAIYRLRKKDSPRADAIIGEALERWLRSGELIEMPFLRETLKGSAAAREVFRRWMRDAASPKNWTAEQAQAYPAFLRNNQAQLKKLSQMAPLPGPVACAVYYGSLGSPRSRLVRSSLSLAATGAAAASAVLMQREFDQGMGRARIEGKALGEKFEAARTPDDFINALRALGLEQPVVGGYPSVGERKFRDAVSEITARAWPKFIRMNPNAAQISELAPYVNDPSVRQDIRSALYAAKPTAADLLGAYDPLAFYPREFNGKEAEIEEEWLNGLAPFFAARPSREEIRRLYKLLPFRSYTPVYAAVRTAPDAETMIEALEEPRPKMEFAAQDAARRLLTLSPTPEQVKRFTALASDTPWYTQELRLKFGAEPKKLVSELLSSNELPKEEIVRILREDTREDRIRTGDLFPSVRGCSYIDTCRVPILLGTAAAREPQELSRLAKLAAISSPDATRALRASMTEFQTRFLALGPSSDDYLRLKESLQSVGNWSLFAAEALKKARNAEEAQRFLQPSPDEVNDDQILAVYRAWKEKYERGGFR